MVARSGGEAAVLWYRVVCVCVFGGVRVDAIHSVKLLQSGAKHGWACLKICLEQSLSLNNCELSVKLNYVVAADHNYINLSMLYIIWLWIVFFYEVSGVIFLWTKTSIRLASFHRAALLSFASFVQDLGLACWTFEPAQIWAFYPPLGVSIGPKVCVLWWRISP
jgi:hypothetical protein